MMTVLHMFVCLLTLFSYHWHTKVYLMLQLLEDAEILCASFTKKDLLPWSSLMPRLCAWADLCAALLFWSHISQALQNLEHQEENLVCKFKLKLPIFKMWCNWCQSSLTGLCFWIILELLYITWSIKRTLLFSRTLGQFLQDLRVNVGWGFSGTSRFWWEDSFRQFFAYLSKC